MLETVYRPADHFYLMYQQDIGWHILNLTLYPGNTALCEQRFQIERGRRVMVAEVGTVKKVCPECQRRMAFFKEGEP